MSNAIADIEERVTILESEVSQLKRVMASPRRPQKRWWREIAGTFANNPDFEEAMRLGREYRESQRDAEI